MSAATLNTGLPRRKRSTPALASNRGSKLKLAKSYPGLVPAQVCFEAWLPEALRLANEYIRTKRDLHRAALELERHIRGMLPRMKGIEV